MAGQVMEAPAMHQHQQASMLLGQLQASCKTDHHLAVTTPASSSPAATTTAAAEMAYLHQLQAAAAANNSNGGGAAQRGEQCPRCASHDTKFCYYNNYNTSQPRHFCRACRRYWTLGGSLRNVPIGGSTRKRPRLAHPSMQPPPTRRQHPAHVVFGGAPATVPAGPPSQGLLGSLFALGAGPLLEGRGGFDLGLGLHMPGGAGEMQGLGLRGGGLGGTSSSALLWPAGLLDGDSMADAWKVPGVVGATAAGAGMWPDFSEAAAPTQQAGGLLHGGAQLM